MTFQLSDPAVSGMSFGNGFLTRLSMQAEGFYSHMHTEISNKACAWFREVCSCCSLTALPGPAWVLFSGICKPFLRSLYRVSRQVSDLGWVDLEFWLFHCLLDFAWADDR